MAIQDVTLVDVRNVQVESIADERFRIAVTGIVEGEGWRVNLHPSIYLHAPETWVIEAVGLTERGASLGPEQTWVAVAELSLMRQTRKIAIRGSRGTVTRPLPW